jgi:hypothetical protein
MTQAFSCGFQLLWPGFGPRSCYIGFVMDEVVL